MVYPALLPLMRTPRLPVVDWTDAPLPPIYMDWRMEWVTSTLYTTSEHGVSSITTADAHTSAASSRLNWRPRRFIWTRSFRRKTKWDFCACAITFQTQCTAHNLVIISRTKGEVSLRIWTMTGLQYGNFFQVTSNTVKQWRTKYLCDKDDGLYLLVNDNNEMGVPVADPVPWHKQMYVTAITDC